MTGASEIGYQWVGIRIVIELLIFGDWRSVSTNDSRSLTALSNVDCLLPVAVLAGML